MKLPFRAAAAVLAAMTATACVAPVGPVEVTRFIAPDAPTLGRGVVRVDAQPGTDPASLEFRTYAAAVGRELAKAGYTEAPYGSATGATQVALLSVQRQTWAPGRDGSPVSVGVGGSTGSYGGGVGLGIGFDLSGPPPEQVATEMRVMIKDAATDKTLWEGRASFTVSAKSEMAQTSLGAAKMAEALFKDFPGNSGETIYVK